MRQGTKQRCRNGLEATLCLPRETGDAVGEDLRVEGTFYLERRGPMESLQTPFQEAREQEPVVAVLNLWVATRENTFLMVLGA